MAAAAVAAELGKNRHHVVGKVNARIAGEITNSQRHLGASRAATNLELGLAIRQADDSALFEASHRGVGDRELAGVRHVAQGAVGPRHGHQQLLLAAGAAELDGGRFDR